MKNFRRHNLLGIMLLSLFCQNGLSQELTGICSFEFWKTATPSDVLLEIELSGLDVNQSCDEVSGDRPIHIALMRSHNDLAIQALIESDASLLVSNNIGETPVILTESMYHVAQEMLEKANEPRLVTRMESFLTQRIHEHTEVFDEVYQQLQNIMRDFLHNSFEDTEKTSYLQADFEERMGAFRTEYQRMHLHQGMQDFEQTEIYTNWLAIRKEHDFLEKLLDDLRKWEIQEKETKNLL